MQFLFPLSVQGFSKVSNLQFLKNKLIQQIKEEGINISHKFVIKKTQKFQTIYAYCIDCTSKLKYRKEVNEENFNLTFMKNHHIHSLEKVRPIGKVFKQLMKSLPINITTKQSKMYFQKHMNISQGQFYYYFHKFRYPEISLEQQWIELDRKGYQIFLDYEQEQLEDKIVKQYKIRKQDEYNKYDLNQQQNQTPKGLMRKINKPKTILLVSPLMKRNSKLYNDVCYYDTTYNIVQSCQGPWKVGVFCGLSSSRSIVPFALSLLLNQNKDSFLKILQNFSRMSSPIDVIVTDDSKAFKQAVTLYNDKKSSKILHLLDNFHVIRSLKKKLINKNSLHLFVKIILAHNTKQFDYWYGKCEENLKQRDLLLLKQIVQKRQKICYSQIQNKFVGTTNTDCIVQKMNDMIKTVLPLQKNLPKVIYTLLNFLEDLGLKCQKYTIEKTYVEDFYGINSIKQLREMVDKKIFSIFWSQLKKSISVEIVNQANDFWEVKDKFNYFKILKMQKYYQCDCLWSVKSGIPCLHEIKLATKKGISMSHLINERWILKFKQQQKFKKIGRPRNTRRHYKY